MPQDVRNARGQPVTIPPHLPDEKAPPNMADAHRIPCCWCAVLAWRSGASYSGLSRQGFIEHGRMRRHLPGCPVREMPEFEVYDRVRRRREILIAVIGAVAILVACFFMGATIYQRTIVSEVMRLDNLARDIITSQRSNAAFLAWEVIRDKNEKEALRRDVQLAIEYVEGSKELAIAEIRAEEDPSIRGEAANRAKEAWGNRSFKK